MATKKRSKGGRASASRVKAVARPRPTSRRVKAKATSKKKVKKIAARTVTKAKPIATAKSVGKAKPIATAKPVSKAKRPMPARAASPKRPAGKPVRNAGSEHPEAVALKAKFQRERSGFERRLTEAVREIGLLRHHEIRATQLERQLAERDAMIGRLQTQLGELERRPTETVYVREVQQTLALVAPTHEIEGAAPDLDEFEDTGLADDGDLVADDE